jgi:hypothetical protein
VIAAVASNRHSGRESVMALQAPRADARGIDSRLPSDLRCRCVGAVRGEDDYRPPFTPASPPIPTMPPGLYTPRPPRSQRPCPVRGQPGQGRQSVRISTDIDHVAFSPMSMRRAWSFRCANSSTSGPRRSMPAHSACTCTCATPVRPASPRNVWTSSVRGAVFSERERIGAK